MMKINSAAHAIAAGGPGRLNLETHSPTHPTVDPTVAIAKQTTLIARARIIDGSAACNRTSNATSAGVSTTMTATTDRNGPFVRPSTRAERSVAKALRDR